MKNYEQPIIYNNEELAEGIYATGSGGQNCWSITYEIKQRNTNPYDPFVNIRIKGEHYAQHSSSAAEIKIIFDSPVRTGVFDSQIFDCNVTGNTVILRRNNHANGFGSVDNFDSNLRIVTDFPATINVVQVSWQCRQE